MRKSLVLLLLLLLFCSPPGPALAGPLELSDDPRGQLTVVFSVKGGSGKSTIAARVATPPITSRIIGCIPYRKKRQACGPG